MEQKKYPGTTSLEISEREITSQKVARRAASEGMVLLKNEGVLPLSKGEKITLYGGGASYTIKGGTGSGMVNNRCDVSIREGLKNAGFNILNEDWLEAYDEEYEACRKEWMQSIYNIAGKPGDFEGLYRAQADWLKKSKGKDEAY